MKLTTFKHSIAKYFRINVFFYSLIIVKYIFYASCDNSCSLENFMQQIAYIVAYIILLDEYVVFTTLLYFELTSQRPLRTPESISCIFFNLNALGQRTLTEQFFECRLRMLGKGLLLKTTTLLVFFLWLVKSLNNF